MDAGTDSQEPVSDQKNIQQTHPLVGSVHHHHVAGSTEMCERMDLRIVPVAFFTLADGASPSAPVRTSRIRPKDP
ncbi:hypothetical protein T4D_17036 [Trichinella pseudospiralis]|uniref:Uncharacterized protein n=1 Tax=Trichinella pseudospiralis TaxID=6337 RepID=A0A0V1FRX7_TRIPS|nr:hypothetical protein T4D_17036 [Trichinella pseudospiralis]